MKVNYASGKAPREYCCSKCGARNCKLWRQYQTVAPLLFCLACAEQRENARLVFVGQVRSDQIGGLVPAVPDEEGAGYWGYTSVPNAGVEWWKQLPTAPARTQ